MTGHSLVFLSLVGVATLGLCVAGINTDRANAQTIAPRRPVPAIANRVAVPSLSGETLFDKRCGKCHELDEDDRGPALRDVYGRMAGHKAGFRYSKALSSRFFNWDETNLDIWLQWPSNMIPGARMRPRVTAPAERAAIIAYLKSVNPNSSRSEQTQ